MDELDKFNIEIERHPWEPFLPEGCKVLILGTFPPKNIRWSMDFYYPNPTNDFWKIMGLIFLDDASALKNKSNRGFDLEKIKNLMNLKQIGLNDTARAVRRLKGNASDKYLDIVEPIPLNDIVTQIPSCRNIVSTGEKAASVLAQMTGTPLPRMGENVKAGELTVWRMPSTSRAYPLALEKKAEYYRNMFESIGIV